MDLPRLLDRFRGRRVAVLGDLAVDCYVETRPDRLSREAPVMVLRYERRRYAPGCAANTVLNLRALGADVLPIGIVGEDEPGEALLAAFRHSGVPADGIVRAGRTVLKVRVVSGDFSRPKQQVLRVDVEPDGAPPTPVRDLLRERSRLADGSDAIVVSDYGYGVASPSLLEGARGGAFVSVDSRERALEFPRAGLLKTNEAEAAALLHRRVESDGEAADAASELKRRSGAGCVLLTRGNRGMVVCDGVVHALPIAGSAEIVDPTGAGDTVVAAATLAHVAGASCLDAARLANLAASVTVMKSGAAVVTPEELLRAAART